MDNAKRSSQVGTGIFLIGLALIFLLNLQFWPFIMFVIAAALLVTEYYDAGRLDMRDNRVITAAVVIIIGLIGFVDINIDWGTLWPLLLIVVGVWLLFGDRIRRG